MKYRGPLPPELFEYNEGTSDEAKFDQAILDEEQRQRDLAAEAVRRREEAERERVLAAKAAVEAAFLKGEEQARKRKAPLPYICAAPFALLFIFGLYVMTRVIDFSDLTLIEQAKTLLLYGVWGPLALFVLDRVDGGVDEAFEARLENWSRRDDDEYWREKAKRRRQWFTKQPDKDEGGLLFFVVMAILAIACIWISPSIPWQAGLVVCFVAAIISVLAGPPTGTLLRLVQQTIWLKREGERLNIRLGQVVDLPAVVSENGRLRAATDYAAP